MMNKIKSSLITLVQTLGVTSMCSSSSVVKSSDPHPVLDGGSSSSSFVSCARLSISDTEKGWVDVDEPSATSQDHLPTANQFDRSLSSSSSSFSISFTMDEMDLVIVNTRGPPLAPSSSFPPPSLNHNTTNSSRPFGSSSSFPPTTSSPPSSSSSSAPSPESSNSFSSSTSTSTSDNSVSSHNTVSLSMSVSSASSYQQFDDSESTTTITSKRTPKSSRSRTIFVMQYSSFKWQEILLAVSFTVPVGLLSTTFKAVDGILVPDVLFTSNPSLFYIFVILDAVAFTASVIGILLHSLKKNKYLYCTSLLAFTALVFAFAIYLWVLLPKFLRFIPYVLLIAILLVLLYASVSLYKRAVSPRSPQQKRLQRFVIATAS